MASNADFTIDADPFANLGFDAAALQVLALKLEDSPALDVRSTNYRVIAKSLNAGTIVELGDPGSAGASPSPNPQDALSITMPAGKGSWLIQCQINGGKGFVGGKAVPVAEFTKLRIVAIRSDGGLREIVPSESTEYDGTFGWTEAIAGIIDGGASSLKDPVRVATDGSLPANTRTGNDRTADANGALAAIDVVAMDVGDSILDKDELTTGADRGIWVITDLGSAGTPWQMTRRVDFDEDAEVRAGMLVPTGPEGTANGSKLYQVTAADDIIVNTTTITFAESGGGLAFSSTPVTDRAIVVADGTLGTNVDDATITILASGGHMRLPTAVEIQTPGGQNAFGLSGADQPLVGDASAGGSVIVACAASNQIGLGVGGAQNIIRSTHASWQYPASAIVATVGNGFRVPNLFGIFARDSSNLANITTFEVTAADEVAVGGANAAGVRLRVGAETLLQALSTQLTISRPTAIDNISGPTATAGSVRLRNNVDINARDAANAANMRLIGSNAGDDVLIGDGVNNDDVIINGAVQLDFQRAGGLVARINTTGLVLSLDLLFERTNATPDITQQVESVSGVSGRPMDHHAQDTVGTGVKTGGSWSTRGGDASGGTDTGGPWDARAGSGAALNGILALRDASDVIVASITAPGEWSINPATQIVTTSQAARAPVVTDVPVGVQTTDATITTAASFVVPGASSVTFTAEVSWRSATDGESGGTIIHGVAERTIGALIVGTNSVAHASAEDAGWGTVQGAPVIVDTSGNDIRVRVEGQAADTINWSVNLHVVEHQAT